MPPSDKDRRTPVPGPPTDDGPPEPKSVTILAETADDWDHAIEEWDLNLHLGPETDDAPPSLRAPSGPGADEGELPLAASTGALPEFRPQTSVPPTLIADLGAVLRMEEGEAQEEEDARIEADLPPLPPSASTPPAVRQARQSAAPDFVAPEPSAPPLPPPPPSSASPVRAAAAHQAEADDDESEPPDEVGLLPPLQLPPASELPPEVALGLEAAPPLPVDDEFYDAIAIDHSERSERSVPRPREFPVRPTWDAPAEPPPSGPLAEISGPPSDPGGRQSLSSWPSGELRFSDGPSAPRERSGTWSAPPEPPPEPPMTITMEADLPPGADSTVTPLAQAVPAELMPDDDRTPIPVAADEQAVPRTAAQAEAEAPREAEPGEAEPSVAEPSVAQPAQAARPEQPGEAEVGIPLVDLSGFLSDQPLLPAERPAAFEGGTFPGRAEPSGTMGIPFPPSSSTPLLGLVARRLPLPSIDDLPPPSRPTSPPLPVGPEERRHALALFEREADVRGADPAAAALRAAAARQMEILGEAGEAQDRYRAALEADAAFRPALRGLRRLLSQPGPAAQPDEAVGLLEREAELATDGDRDGLLIQRGELLSLLGQGEAARAALREGLPAVGAGEIDPAYAVAVLGGLRDAALRGGKAADDDLAAAERGLADLPAMAGHPALRAALRVERARLDEAAGSDAAAAAGYAAALDDLEPGPGQIQAGLGLLRCAGRLRAAARTASAGTAGGQDAGRPDGTALLRRALAALAGALPPSPLRAAILRRGALAAQTLEERRPLLSQAAEAGDRLALDDLGRLLAEAGSLAEAAQCYAGVAERSADPARRADALTRAGEAFEQSGQLDEARAALQEALRCAATLGVDYDAVTERALERVDRQAGRPEDLLQLARREARHRTGPFAPAAHLAAARILLAQGADAGAAATTPAGDAAIGQVSAHADLAGAAPAPAGPADHGIAQAIAELQSALALRPDFGPAVLLLRQLLCEAGRHEEAAAALRASLALPFERGEGLPGPTRPEAGDRDSRGAGEAAPRGDAAWRLFCREDAARLLGRAGRGGEGAALLAEELQAATQPATARALRWQIGRLLGPRIELVPETEPRLASLLADTFAAEAAAAEAPGPGNDRPRAADLWYRRGLLLGPAHPQIAVEGGPVEESLGRALTLEPAHGPSLLALSQRALSALGPSAETPTVGGRFAGSKVVQLLLESYRERLLGATGRPEAVVLLLRLGALQEHEAHDARGALLTLNLLRSVAPAHPGASDMEEGLLHLARRAGDPQRTLALLDDELGREQDEDLRFALLIQIGELYESLGQGQAAAERFEQALELRRGHPVARSALWRVYQLGGEFPKLRQLAEAELREAVDFAGRVAACDRIAALASLDPEQARDPKNAIAAYQELLTVDANHHLAMRVLERHFIAEQNWGDLIHLYEQMGLTATDTTFAVHIHLERAHLRQKLAWQSADAEPPEQLVNELENDFRLALYRDRHSRPALRHILAAALRTQDFNQVADLSTRLAEVCDQSGSGRGEAGDGRAASVFLTRAAECYAALQQTPDLVVQTFRDALGRNPRHLPAIRGLLHFSLLQGLAPEATEAAELCAEAIHDPAARYHYYLLAGALAQEQLQELPRALASYREALRIDPTRGDGFDRIRQILLGSAGTPSDPHALAELLTEQLQLENDPARQVALRLDLATVLRDELQNRARAKVELRQALAYDPHNAPVLEMLAALHYEDGDWVEAVDSLVRLARAPRSPEELAEIFLRLGQIYSEHMPDPRRAVAAYTKALELLPDHVPALSQLSALHLQQGRPEHAVPLLERLSELVSDREQRVAYLHRAARLLEGGGEGRLAQQLFQRAVDVDPMYLPAVGALASFFDRQSDVTSMRVHLDRAAGRFRQILHDAPLSPEPYLALVQIFQWRRATDLAVQAAAAAAIVGAALPPEAQPLLERERRAEGYPGANLRDPQLDDLLFPSSIPPGLRNLFQLLHEPLGKQYRAEWKRLEALGVNKREKLPRTGHPVRDLANRIASDMGVAPADFDIYVTAAQGKDASGRPVPLCTVEPTEPPSLVLSQSLLGGAPEAELRFSLGRLLKLVQARMVLPLQLPPDDLGILLGGLVRMFVKDYAPIGIAEKRLEAEAQRLHRLIPRKLEAQLLPFAMECSSATLDAAEISAALWPTSNHAGLLVAGSLTAAAAALRRMGPAGEAALAELLQFALSREYEEMRSLVGTSLG